MKHHPKWICSIKSQKKFSHKTTVPLLLLVGSLFLSPDIWGNENAGIGNTGREVPESTDSESTTIPRAVLYLPLSTWIGPGDLVRIKTYPDTALFVAGDYPILENGFAMLPLLGLVQVTNLSISAFTGFLTKNYSKYLAYPTIQVEPIIRLSFLGGFLKPGMHKVNPMYSFANALSAAEGTVRDDGLKLLRWERGGKVLSENLISDVEGRKSLYAMGFKSGDQICITILTQRDRLQVISLILSTILASATIVTTLLVLNK